MKCPLCKSTGLLRRLCELGSFIDERFCTCRVGERLALCRKHHKMIGDPADKTKEEKAIESEFKCPF